MSEMLTTGLDYLADWMKEHNSREVRYEVGESFVLVQAIIGKFKPTAQEVEQFQLEGNEIDFAIQAADLVIDSEQVTPTRGHRIIDSNRGKTVTYEVLAPRGMPVWRWADHEKTRRIHAKPISSEDA